MNEIEREKSKITLSNTRWSFDVNSRNGVTPADSASRLIQKRNNNIFYSKLFYPGIGLHWDCICTGSSSHICYYFRLICT
jgi:hypothetical protein